MGGCQNPGEKKVGTSSILFYEGKIREPVFNLQYCYSAQVGPQSIYDIRYQNISPRMHPCQKSRFVYTHLINIVTSCFSHESQLDSIKEIPQKS